MSECPWERDAQEHNPCPSPRTTFPSAVPPANYRIVRLDRPSAAAPRLPGGHDPPGAEPVSVPALVADRHGVSFYRQEKICDLLGLDAQAFAVARDRLVELQLLAFEPYSVTSPAEERRFSRRRKSSFLALSVSPSLPRPPNPHLYATPARPREIRPPIESITALPGHQQSMKTQGLTAHTLRRPAPTAPGLCETQKSSAKALVSWSCSSRSSPPLNTWFFIRFFARQRSFPGLFLTVTKYGLY